ncbi:hypothetical protein BH100L_03654 [Escherichia coli]|nr:hypothetical protein BH100B_03804 [Escherichia coli]AUN92230.1 hypothetical protein BH100N_03813 [Escherichia coli]AUQ39238.1 hypothetical protein BH100L_03654 [Escherichia coli]EZJ35772.1 hypothetical protein AD23_3756 [Escherichia coli 2-005-03_S4_C3]EZJ48699.1 hypothetical protein AC93_3615 [Escherichia coli 2-005-03_S4_C2]
MLIRLTKFLQFIEFSIFCWPDNAFTRIRYKQSALCQQT